MKSLKQHISLFHKRWIFRCSQQVQLIFTKNLSKPVVLICDNLHYANDSWHEETTRGHPLHVLLWLYLVLSLESLQMAKQVQNQQD